MDEETGAPATEEQEQEQSPDQRYLDQQKRAEKAEARAKELEGIVDTLSQKEEETQPPLEPQEVPNQFDQLADNLSVLKPLEENEIEELRSQAKDLGVDPIKFAQSPAWKAHLETLRVNAQAEAKTPESSTRTAVFEGKTYDEVVSAKDSTPESRQAAFLAQRDALLNRGRNQMI